jgi:hypothetical protein
MKASKFTDAQKAFVTAVRTKRRYRRHPHMN